MFGLTAIGTQLDGATGGTMVIGLGHPMRELGGWRRATMASVSTWAIGKAIADGSNMTTDGTATTTGTTGVATVIATIAIATDL